MPARRRWLMTAAACLLGAAGGLAGAAGCTEEVSVTIESPAPGSMLPAGQGVTVTVKVKADEAEVDGQTVSKGTREVTVAEVDGLGFVVARVPGERLLSVRSYHQGGYEPAHDFNPGTLSLYLGEQALSDDAAGAVSVASLIATILQQEELESFVEDPLQTQAQVTIPFVGTTTVDVTIEVTSVIADAVDMRLWYESDGLHFRATLYDVPVAYTATAPAHSLSCSGTADYDEVEITGRVDLTGGTAVLTDLTSDTVGPDLTCAGALPLSEDFPPVRDLLDQEVPAAIGVASQNAADAVFPKLIDELRPSVSINYQEPITLETRVGDFAPAGRGIGLTYDTLIEAATAREADEGHGVLARTATQDSGDASGIAVSVGSALINQFSFALWDAGNFAGLHYTQQELEDMGMQSLESPYDKLNHVDVTLLLPPLLEWSADGPRLDIGGIEIALDVSSVSNSTAWTAASVPVRLVQAGNDLQLERDPEREVTIREVGFDRLSSLADQNKVLRLMETAVPGVVATVFGALPTIVLDPISLSRLDGSDGPVVTPQLAAVTARADTWLLELSLATQ